MTIFVLKIKQEMAAQELPNISIELLRQNFSATGNLQNDFLTLQTMDEDEETPMEDLFMHPSRINAFVFLLCLKGEMRVRINLQEYTIGANMLLFNLPNNIIQSIDSPSKDFDAKVIFISQEFLQEIRFELQTSIPLYVHFKDMPYIQLAPEDIAQLLQYFELLYTENNAEDQGQKKDIIRNLSSATMHKTASLLNKYLAQNIPPTPSSMSRQDAFFEQFMALLSQYHRKERSVTFYAGKLHITPKYFSGLIKQVSGRSAVEWINDFVILEAKALLKHSGKSIQEVAYELNFPSQTFFGKYFKRLTGLSPSEYKAQ